MQKVSDTIKTFPKTPGVYLFRNAKKTVLYVGKATSLRDRVRQYFSGHDSRGVRIERLVAESASVDYIETDSVLEALILEAELIKKYQPKYNVEGKDDKSFSYFLITKEQFPRVLILHKTDFDKKKFQTEVYAKGRHFGPYTSRKQMQTALKIIRKIFPFHSRSEKSEKGCLSYHIGLCPGPYAGAISEADYGRNIRHIALFLSGRKKALLTQLERQMRALAKVEKFEAAQKVKQQIFALEHIRDVSLLTNDKQLTTDNGEAFGKEGAALRVEGFDISHIGGEHQVASMVVFVGGVPEKAAYRKFRIKAVKGANDVAAMREVLARRLQHVDDWGLPDALVLDGGKGHLAMAEKLISDLQITTNNSQRLGLLAVAKGPTRKKVDVYASTVFPPPASVVTDKKLLEDVREEAHRFAITYHKKLRDKNLLKGI